MEVTPKNLLIKPDIESKVKGYIFPQIPATDHKYFEVTSKNAILFNKNGQLMLKPLDNEPIEMQFRTDSVWKALIIPIVSWSMVIGLMLTQLVAKRKRSKEYNSYGQ
jgi:hypothetical protein